MKGVIALLGIHFAVLIMVQWGIQMWVGNILHFANALFGLVWIFTPLIIIFFRGGLMFDALAVAYVSTHLRFVESVMRVLIGFFTIESFVNICFSIFPFYTHPGAFGLLLMSTVSYFMFRHMARATINWANWVWFPAANMAFAILAILYSYAGGSQGIQSMLGLDYGDGMILLGLGMLAFWLMTGSKKTTTNTPAQHQGGHHGHH